MKKFLKITGIAIGLIILLLLVLPFVLKDKLVVIVKNEANKALNAKFDFETLDLSFFSHFPKASIELKGLKITGIGDFEGDTLVSAEKISAAVNIMSLFGDEGFDIHYIGLEKPVIRAIKLENGHTNWDIVKSSSSPKEKTDGSAKADSSSFSLKLDQMVIENGNITFLDDSSKIAFHTGNLNLELQGDMSAQQSKLNCILKAGDMYLALDNTPYLNRAEAEIKMKLDADFEKDKYTLDKNNVRLNAIEMNLDGWVALVEQGMDMDLKINTPKIAFKDILSLIPAVYQNNFDALQTSGKLSLEAQIKGILAGNSLPAFQIRLDVNNATFNYDNMPKAVEQIFIAALVTNPGGDADNTVIDLSNLSFNMAGNPFKATFRATHPVSDLHFKATADGKINLDAVKEIYPLPDSVNLNGTVTTHLDFGGRMSDIEQEKYENITGSGDLAIQDMSLNVKGFPSLSISQASASVSPKALSLNDLNLKIGESDIQAKGSLNNYLPYFLKSEKLTGNLDLTSQLLNVNELMSSSGDKSPTAAADDTSVMQVIRVPENLDLRLSANLKRILYQKMDIRNFTGNLRVSNGVVDMNPVKASAFGGKIDAKGSYRANTTMSNPEIQLALNISQASFEETFKQLEMVQKMVPIFAKTGGTYSVDLDLKTPLDKNMQPDLEALYAKGILQSNDIHLQNIELFGQLADLLKNEKLKNIQAKDIKIPFLIENGLLKTQPFDLKMGGININLSGTTSLTQKIDYIAQITLPEGSQIGNIVSKANVLIGGTFSKPEFKLDTKGLVQDALKQALGDKLQGTKAGELLNGNSEEQIAKIRAQAEEAGKKLVDIAQKEGDKLVEKAKNPLAKIAAEKASEKLVKEAKKQADQLVKKADEQIKELQKK